MYCKNVIVSAIFYLVILLKTVLMGFAANALECYTLTINSTLTLQSATGKLVSEYSGPSNCVQIGIVSGTHDITSQSLFSATLQDIDFHKIEIMGIGKGVVVTCNYDVHEHYTWNFKGLSSVTFRGIYFKNCPRPIILDTIENVTILNCTFR